MASSTFGNLDFETLEKLSQDCSKKIVFDLLDKKTTIENSKQEIQECQRILVVYKQRLMEKHDLKNLNPLTSEMN